MTTAAGLERTDIVTPNPVYVPAWNRVSDAASRVAVEEALTERDCWRCFYCGDDFANGRYRRCQIDHVIPAACGGSDELDNLVWACGTCNVRKARKRGWFFVVWLWHRDGTVNAEAGSLEDLPARKGTGN